MTICSILSSLRLCLSSVPPLSTFSSIILYKQPHYLSLLSNNPLIPWAVYLCSIHSFSFHLIYDTVLLFSSLSSTSLGFFLSCSAGKMMLTSVRLFMQLLTNYSSCRLKLRTDVAYPSLHHLQKMTMLICSHRKIQVALWFDLFIRT